MKFVNCITESVVIQDVNLCVRLCDSSFSLFLAPQRVASSLDAKVKNGVDLSKGYLVPILKQPHLTSTPNLKVNFI